MKKSVSLRKTLMKEGLRALSVWLLIAIIFGVFQIALFRKTQLTELERKLQDITAEHSLRMESFLNVNQDQQATQIVLKSLKATYNLNSISLNQSFYSFWPETNCSLLDQNTESCKDFLNGSVQLRRLMKSKDGTWALMISKGLNRPWGSYGWWSASLIGFFTTLFILGLLFLRLLYLFRNEVILPFKELPQYINSGRSQRQLWLKNQKSLELQRIANILFQQKDELDRKNSLTEVGKVSTHLAHDIRSPLSLLQVLLTPQKSGLSKAEVEMAAKATERIAEIAEGLLKTRNQSQSEIDNQSSLLTLSWLQESIDTLITEHNFRLRRQGIYFESQFSSKCNDLEDTPIGGNAMNLLRSVENLIKNAAEACIYRSQESFVRISMDINNENLELKILDSGCGLSSEQLQKIAVGESFSTKENGNNLGLSSTIDYLKNEGASYTISSVQSGGTLFEIKHPLQ